MQGGLPAGEGPPHLPLAAATREQNLVPDRLCLRVRAEFVPPRLRSRGRRWRLLPAWVRDCPSSQGHRAVVSGTQQSRP